MGKLTSTERESRIKRVYDLHKEGLSLRKIKAQLATEGYSVSIGQIASDIRAAKAKEEVLTGYIPFWCDNKTQNYPNCCFNHRVGMPSEAAITKQKRVPTIYDYQMELFNAVQEHRRVLMVKSRKIGATELLKRAIAYFAIYGFTKGYQSLIIPGTRMDLARRHVKDIRLLLERGKYEDLINAEETRADALFLKNGSEILAFPSNSSAARGLQNVMLIFLDEAAHFDTQDQADILNASEGNLAVTDGHLIMISTPRGRRGMFYESHMDKSDHWYKIYMHYTRALGKVLSENTIEGFKKGVNFDFQQEFCNQFSTVENAVYTKAFLNASTGDFNMVETSPGEWRLREPVKHTRAVAGLDIARSEAHTAIVVHGRLLGEEERWYPILVKIWPHITWPTIITDIEHIYTELKINEIAGDKTGMGEGFIDFVIAKQINVDKVVFTAASKTEMINHNTKLFQARELVLPKNEPQELLIQFEEQMKTDTGNGWQYSKPEKRADDAFWAWHLASKLIAERGEHFAVIV